MPPSSSSTQMRPRAAGLLHPPVGSDPFTDCNLSGRVWSCGTGGNEGRLFEEWFVCCLVTGWVAQSLGTGWAVHVMGWFAETFAFVLLQK